MRIRFQALVLLCACCAPSALFVVPATANPPAQAATEPKTPLAELAAQPFLLVVEDVFSISGRGTVVTGRVARGQIKVGDEVEIFGGGETKRSVVEALEEARQWMNVAAPGDECANVLRSAKRDDLKRGQVLAAPGSIGAHREFKAAISLLSSEDGGRRTPIFQDYCPQFNFYKSDVTGTLASLGGVETRISGGSFRSDVVLIESVALGNGLAFHIREGGRVVGKGVVLEIKKTPEKADTKPTS